MRVAGIILAVASLNVFVVSSESPSFCHKLDCPLFELVRSLSPSVEIRQYPVQQWVSYSELNTDFDSSMTDGFNKLFQYISGSNDKQVKVEMTAPVLLRVIASQGPFCKTNFTTSFYVPRQYQTASPPKPSENDVFLDSYGEDQVAVLSFGGFAKFEDAKTQLLDLYNTLTSYQIAYDQDTWAFAGYDAPYRVSGRHNEVWVPLLGASK